MQLTMTISKSLLIWMFSWKSLHVLIYILIYRYTVYRMLYFIAHVMLFIYLEENLLLAFIFWMCSCLRKSKAVLYFYLTVRNVKRWLLVAAVWCSADAQIKSSNCLSRVPLAAFCRPPPSQANTAEMLDSENGELPPHRARWDNKTYFICQWRQGISLRKFSPGTSPRFLLLFFFFFLAFVVDSILLHHACMSPRHIPWMTSMIWAW